MKKSAQNIFLLFLSLFIFSSCSIFQISYDLPEIKDFFKEAYNSKELDFSLYPTSKIDSININELDKTVNIYFDKDFATIPFRENNVNLIYNETERYFSQYLHDYKYCIYALDINIRELIPNYFRKDFQNIDSSRIPIIKSRTNPITFNRSKNLKPSKGLFNRNIALWHSHGWYYDHKLDRWLWQRARLFQTVEDLGPMSFTIPFLIPMLENAGAHVFVPRERDTQLNEIIIDDTDENCRFITNWNVDSSKGFSIQGETIKGNINPFKAGSYHYTTSDSRNFTIAEYIPDIPETGEYSVYVSYQSNENSSRSVLYSIFHSGGKTDFEVNQQIGGGTWIHLGKFKFLKGKDSLNSKVTINSSISQNGELITADAVRFGGGYGVIERYGSTSGRPKYMEGARYYLQFCGMPDTLVYSLNDDQDDYKDDYQSRGEWVNYLIGSPNGPNMNRNADGLGISMDASIAFHTDAGISDSDTTIGTLLIYSLNDMDSTRFFPNGYSRFANRDFADIMQTQIVHDIITKYDRTWSRRQLRDDNYSEAARPNVPSALLELASHQNFLDVRFMSDPMFKFDISRSIYKSVLKFLSAENNFKYVVQPLPVKHFSIELIDSNSVKLSWEKQEDPIEITASPDRYLLYMGTEENGFDNGIYVDTNFYEIKNLKKNNIYNFKVTAANNGGESFPSETLSCGISDHSGPPVLVVNCFDRISPPAYIETDKFSGYLNNIDQGVSYQYDISYTGEQHNFFPASEWKSDDIPGHGASYANYETKIIAGNTFNFPYIHGRAILENGYSFVSVSDESVETGKINLTDYEIIDLIIGEEKTTFGTKPFADSVNGLRYEIFTDNFLDHLTYYLDKGGNIFLSGSYVGSDVFLNPIYSEERLSTISSKLKYKLAADHAVKKGDIICIADNFLPVGFEFSFVTEFNDSIYNAEAPDALSPANGSEILLRYKENLFGAALGYKDEYGIIIFGFPFETIELQAARKKVMSAILNYFRKE